jgi:hypothetical protein
VTRPDVPASALVRRTGNLHPDAQRVKHIELVRPDPRARCQVCGEGAGQPLVILCPVVDRDNGQRITIALCRSCAEYSGKIADHTVPPPARTATTSRRKRR